MSGRQGGGGIKGQPDGDPLADGPTLDLDCGDGYANLNMG